MSDITRLLITMIQTAVSTLVCFLAARRLEYFIKIVLIENGSKVDKSLRFVLIQSINYLARALD